MEEEYKIITGYENYSVSNFGNVKNNYTGRILKPGIDKKGYLFVILSGEIKKTFKIHRLVAQAFIPNLYKPIVDHIDNDRANNCVDNLRYVTNQENIWNSKLSSRNKCNVKGVSWKKGMNKWQAAICVDGKSKYLGLFDNIDDAKKVRQEYANKIFGEYTNKCEKIIHININIENLHIHLNEAEELKKLFDEIEKIEKI